MPSEKEIEAAAYAYQDCDSYAVSDMMKAALEAAEKVRVEERVLAHGFND